MWKSAALKSSVPFRRSLLKATSTCSSWQQSCSRGGIHQQNQQAMLMSTAPNHNGFDLGLASNLARQLKQDEIEEHNKESTSLSFVADLDTPRTSVLMELTDRVGVLHDVLKFYWKYDVNITHIESRPHKLQGDQVVFDFYIDL